MKHTWKRKRKIQSREGGSWISILVCGIVGIVFALVLAALVALLTEGGVIPFHGEHHHAAAFTIRIAGAATSGFVAGKTAVSGALRNSLKSAMIYYLIMLAISLTGETSIMTQLGCAITVCGASLAGGILSGDERQYRMSKILRQNAQCNARAK